MNIENIPSSAQLEKELKRAEYNHRYRKTLISTLSILITAAAIAIIVATLWLPVLQIYGASMSPTLNEGEIVLSVKEQELEQGDIIAFYYGNKLLVKRCIAGPGSWVDILEDGTVIVDNQVIDEPYVEKKSLGKCDIEFPYQVPENKYFLLGDHRETSLDSRHSMVGCVSKEQVVGKIVFRVWPLNNFGTIDN